MCLDRLGQTNCLSAGVEDGIVLPDEDISQDPELLATLAKASPATVGALWRDNRAWIYITQDLMILLKKVSVAVILADLRDVGRCRDGEGVSVEGEGDLRHALDVLAVHCSLQEEGHT